MNMSHPEQEVNHHICEKQDINGSVKIECYNCINNIKEAMVCKSSGAINYSRNCTCRDKIITSKTCNKCEEIKETITNLKDELDNLLYHLSYNIKNYEACGDAIARIADISILLRERNSILLEKL